MDSNTKTQVIERIKSTQNVLVTVSDNPNVDQLCAAVGITLMLNKMGKHATAVFSGQVPSTIEFIKPEATLEQNTDSLRDFIIALDKSKADKLRYKIEDDVVKIFITPYRTSLSEQDLQFSQGDFNVDTVLALGVDNRDHVDSAIIAHGRIFHDATIIGVMAGKNKTDVGSINWLDSEASSLCEMLVDISESLQPGVIDGQMATAFLTGMVAETVRFRNEKTTPKVMTMAAKLMAAGANQQLIANNLDIAPQPAEPEPIPNDQGPVAGAIPESAPSDNSNEYMGEINLQNEHRAPTVPEEEEEEKPDQIQIDNQGTLKISTHKQEDLGEPQVTPIPPAPEETKAVPPVPAQPAVEEQANEKPYGDYLVEPPRTQPDLDAIQTGPEVESSYDALDVIPQAVLPEVQNLAQSQHKVINPLQPESQTTSSNPPVPGSAATQENVPTSTLAVEPSDAVPAESASQNVAPTDPDDLSDNTMMPEPSIQEKPLSKYYDDTQQGPPQFPPPLPPMGVN